MKRKIFFLGAMIAMALLVIAPGCSSSKKEVKAVKATETKQAPPEGMPLAKAADRVPIENGPANPVRRVLWQSSKSRPCWAHVKGEGCKPNLPGEKAFVGTSSGAATKEGAILNAYQNAIEEMARFAVSKSGAQTPAAKEKIRYNAYDAAGVFDKSYKLKKEAWVQKWEEKTKVDKRIYFRAFVLLAVPEKEIFSLFK